MFFLSVWMLGDAALESLVFVTNDAKDFNVFTFEVIFRR